MGLAYIHIYMYIYIEHIYIYARNAFLLIYMDKYIVELPSPVFVARSIRTHTSSHSYQSLETTVKPLRELAYFDNGSI